jgi:riboflavin transporter FmnP
MKLDTRQLAIASLLGALSIISELTPGPPFDIKFPLYDQVSWDLTGIPMMISLLLFGLTTGLYTTLVGCSVLMLRNPTGGTFKLIAELATLFGYSILSKSVILRSILATASRVLIMTVANYVLLQAFYRIPESYVVSLLPVLAVFNISQALINIVPSLMIATRIRNWVGTIIQPISTPLTQ